MPTRISGPMSFSLYLWWQMSQNNQEVRVWGKKRKNTKASVNHSQQGPTETMTAFPSNEGSTQRTRFPCSWSGSKGRVCGVWVASPLCCDCGGGRGALEVGGDGLPAERSNPRRPWQDRYPVFECERVTSGLERVWVARQGIQRGGLCRARSCLDNPG